MKAPKGTFLTKDDKLSMDSHTVKQAEGLFSVTITERLGHGSFGYAFLTSCNRVIKFTKSPNEFSIANKMKGIHYIGLVHVYDTCRIDDWYAILQEFLTKERPHPWTFTRAHHLVSRRLLDWTDDPNTVDGMLSDTAKLITDIGIAVTEANTLGISCLDLHQTNIGFRNGNYVCFDIMERVL